MVTIEEFEQLIVQVDAELPPYLFEDLNGGVLLDPAAKPHPAGERGDLWILGEYHREKFFGRFIVIYYGSFMKVYGHLDGERLKSRVRQTVRHEFLHHLESLAGLRDLEVLDAMAIRRYRSFLPVGEKEK